MQVNTTRKVFEWLTLQGVVDFKVSAKQNFKPCLEGKAWLIGM
jgi:hypothetical protein